MFGVGDRIRERRLALGLSQTELAKRIGNSNRCSISRDERDGETITTRRLSLYAKALNCTEAYLMGQERVTGDDDVDLLSIITKDKSLANVVTTFLNLNDEHREIVEDQIYSLARREAQKSLQ